MHLPDLDDEQCRRIATIASSYARLTGRPLVEAASAAAPAGSSVASASASAQQSAGARQSSREIVAALWNGPLAIVAHGTESDPVFFFGNRMALELFEMDFAAFTRLPSRYSAEPLLREERALLLDRVTRNGIITDYAGVRISATGRRFGIENAAVWNLTDATGATIGQAAAFAEWRSVG